MCFFFFFYIFYFIFFPQTKRIVRTLWWSISSVPLKIHSRWRRWIVRYTGFHCLRILLLFFLLKYINFYPIRILCLHDLIVSFCMFQKTHAIITILCVLVIYANSSVRWYCVIVRKIKHTLWSCFLGVLHIKFH